MNLKRGRCGLARQRPLFAHSGFHLLTQEPCDSLADFLLGFSHRRRFVVHQYHDTAHQVAAGENGGRHTQIVAVHAFRSPEPVAAGIAVGFPLLHNLLQLMGILLVHEIPFRCTAEGDNCVPVRYCGNPPGVPSQTVANLRCKLAQFTHGRVFLEDDLAVLFCENLQGVTLADSQGSSDFLGDNHPAQIIPLCQVGAKKFFKFFKKPTKTDG